MVDKRSRWIATFTAAFDHPVIGIERGRPFTRFEAWQWLIAHAAWQDHQIRSRGRIIQLRRGQLPAAREYLAAEWRWGAKRVRNFLDQLASEGMLEKGQSAGHYANIITIANYEKYQSASDLVVEVPRHQGPVKGPVQGQTFTLPTTTTRAREVSSGDLYDRLVEAAGECLCPIARGLGLNSVATVLGWINAGADLEIDILPTVARLGKRALPGSVRAWSYFASAVSDAKAARERGLPAPSTVDRGLAKRPDFLRELRVIGGATA